MGTMFIIDSLHMTFFYGNVMNIPQLVRTGGLDDILLKPVNSRILISMKQISLSSMINLIFGICLVIYSYMNLNITIRVSNVILYLILVINGVMIMYSILFMATTLSIFFGKTEELIMALFDIFQFGMKPEGIYKGVFKKVITYIIPLLVIANFPTIAVIGRLSMIHIVWGMIVTILLLVFSNILWNISLKKYCSATS